MRFLPYRRSAAHGALYVPAAAGASIAFRGALGTNKSKGANINDIVLTTAATSVSTGDTIVALMGSGSAVNFDQVTDSASNTYALVNTYSGSAGRLTLYVALNCNALAAGGTITARLTTRPATVDVSILAGAFSGIATSSAVDKAPSTGSTSSGVAGPGFTQATVGDLAQANELMLALMSTASKPATSTTPGTGYTEINNIDMLAGDNYYFWGYKIVSSVSGNQINPSWVPDKNYSGNLASLKGA